MMRPIRALALVTVLLLAHPAAAPAAPPRVDNHGLNAIAGFAYSSPYEDLTLKKK